MNLDALKKLSPAWWGAIAGAVAAGASLFPDSRLVGGVAAGAAMFYVAKKVSAPCCAACAGEPVELAQASATSEARTLDFGLDGASASAPSCPGCLS